MELQLDTMRNTWAVSVTGLRVSSDCFWLSCVAFDNIELILIMKQGTLSVSGGRRYLVGRILLAVSVDK